MIRKKVRKKIKNTKREQILDAGIRLFARMPFADITIAAVAREANCVHSLVYHYFDNINELYDAAVDHVASLFLPLIRNFKQLKTTPELIFIGTISRIVDGLNSISMYAYYLNLFSFKHSLTPTNEKVYAIQEEWYSFFINIIREAQDNGRLITVLSAEEILTSVQTIIQGQISSQIFSFKATGINMRASYIYLPLLKGVQ